MRITISGKNFNISEKVEERLTRKLNKMDRYFGSEVEAQARLSLEKNNRNICEVTIPIEGGIVRAEESAEDMFKAIDRCLEKLERQIRKYRTQLEKRLKDGAFAAAPEYFTETEATRKSTKRSWCAPRRSRCARWRSRTRLRRCSCWVTASSCSRT